MKKFLLLFISTLCVTLGIGIYNVANLVSEKYETSSFEAIAYHLRNRIDGTDSEVVWQFASCFIWPACIMLCLSLLLWAFGERIFKSYSPVLLINFAVFLIGAGCGLGKLGFFSYVINKTESSTFIEENYVAAENDKIIRPEKKKNLIIVYLESMESSYASVETGGMFDVNMIPNLVKIANENLNFSTTDKFGGTDWIEGTGWTTAGIINTTAGIPVFSPVKIDYTNEIPSFSYKQLLTLADVLHTDGYRERFLIGTDINFGGMGDYVRCHGRMEVPGFLEIKAKGDFSLDEVTGWGLSDRVVFQAARKELDSLAKDTSSPFFYTIVTIDTHSPVGFVSKDCDCHLEDSYSNAIACADYRMGEFYQWLRKQSFFDNTVIVFMGDHRTMNTAYFEGKGNSDRRIYNVFINSVVKTARNRNREFTQLDLYPTILASMGYGIVGNRLGLGVNLFSDEPTLYEKYGEVPVLTELRKYSAFYYKNILFRQ